MGRDEALAAMKASGRTEITAPTADEYKAWVKAMLPVHQEVAKRVGAETLEAVYAVVGDPRK